MKYNITVKFKGGHEKTYICRSFCVESCTVNGVANQKYLELDLDKPEDLSNFLGDWTNMKVRHISIPLNDMALYTIKEIEE